MHNWNEWLALAGICLLGAMSPGPSLAVVIRHSVESGRRHGLSAALSHGLGVGLYALISVLGIAALIVAHPSLLYGLQAAGAVFLLWLAFMAMRTAVRQPKEETVKPPTSYGAAWRDGFLIAFLNPKIAVFFLALFSQFVDADQAMMTKSLMAAMAMAIDTLWYMVVALLLSLAPARLAFLRWRRGFEALFSLLLAAVALRMLWLLAERFVF